MSARHRSARAIRRALDVLLELPAAALADLAERLIERLDAATPDPEAEPDDDGEFDQHGACECGDDDPRSSFPQFGAQEVYGPGDPEDAEPCEDREPDADAEPDRHALPPPMTAAEFWSTPGRKVARFTPLDRHGRHGAPSDMVVIVPERRLPARECGA